MNYDVLKSIVAGEKSYISAADGKDLVDAGLIEVNTAIHNPEDAQEVACRATPAGQATAGNGPVNEAPKTTGNYQIMTNVELPPARKRGNTAGSGAPTKYPFADLPVNGTFFSANSEHAKGDAVKALGSTVSAQNDKYSEPTGQMKTVTRAVRDPQTKKAVMENGKKVTETVELPVKKYNRKFTIRPVSKGQKLGGWTAPDDGALIGRIL